MGYTHAKCAYLYYKSFQMGILYVYILYSCLKSIQYFGLFC